MAKVKKAGVKKSFETITKELRTCCDNYQKALKKFGEDLEKMQSGDEGSTPAWNGRRAKTWMNDAITKGYNKNIKDLNQLMAFTSQCEVAVIAAKQQK